MADATDKAGQPASAGRPPPFTQESSTFCRHVACKLSQVAQPPWQQVQAEPTLLLMGLWRASTTLCAGWSSGDAGLFDRLSGRERTPP